jgi:hypothetical protein
MSLEPQHLLDDSRLDALAAEIDLAKAMPWGGALKAGDTVWMGVVDANGLAVSFIQSIYHEFGSGVVLPTTGLNWQNRGASFSLDPRHLQALLPGKKPFHTLNPAAAKFTDGRRMVYGTMGGDGQPQTQAAIFSRAIWLGQELQQAISAPRWVLGRTWGQSSDTLKLELRTPDAVVHDLEKRGHDIEMLAAFDEAVGHAGAIIRNPSGVLEGGSDPRSDGCLARDEKMIEHPTSLVGLWLQTGLVEPFGPISRPSFSREQDMTPNVLEPMDWLALKECGTHDQRVDLIEERDRAVLRPRIWLRRSTANGDVEPTAQFIMQRHRRGDRHFNLGPRRMKSIQARNQPAHREGCRGAHP